MVCVSEPDVPVKATVAIVAWALLAEEKVTVSGLPAVTVSAEDDAVTPAGKPDICTEALDENPFRGVRLTAVCAVPPGAIEIDAGLNPKEKSGEGGAAVICTAKSTVCVREADVPVRSSVVVVAAALLAAVKMTVWGLLALTVYVGAEAVTPAGKPEN
jgi:hypothetical protein